MSLIIFLGPDYPERGAKFMPFHTILEKFKTKVG